MNVATPLPRLVKLVPPFATGSVPVTPEVSVTCAQAGTLLVPVLVNTLVEEVDLARRAGVFAAEAYMMSPAVVMIAGAVNKPLSLTCSFINAAVTISPVVHVL